MCVKPLYNITRKKNELVFLLQRDILMSPL
jgi:hypothetical protein